MDWLREGEAHFQAGRLDDAERCFHAALAAHPDNQTARNDLGVLAFERGRVEEAISWFVQVLERDPLDRAALCNLSVPLLQLGRGALAQPLLARALEAQPEDPELAALAASCQIAPSPFLNRIPPALWGQKTGRNILVFADYNTAGQLTLLCDALNRYTPHKARCVILHDDYLGYGRDLVLYEGKALNRQVVEEAAELLGHAEFFHLGNGAFDVPGFSLSAQIHANNCIVQYFGTYLRVNYDRLFLWHLKTNIAALVGFGWTLSFPLPRRFYHIQQFTPLNNLIRSPRLLPDMVPRVVHAPTNRQVKRTDLFLSIMERIAKDMPVEVDVIEKVSHAECMARKAKGHILYDELGTPTFGLSSLESMAMGQACLSSVNPHVLSYYPDLPLVRVTEDTLEPLLRQLLTTPALVNHLGELGQAFVAKHYDSETSAIRFGHLYEGIIRGFFHTDPGIPNAALSFLRGAT